MQNVLLFVSCAAGALFSVQACLIFVRCSIHRRRDASLLLAASLVLCAAFPLLADHDWLREIAVIGALGTMGAFLSRAGGRGRLAAWTAAGIGFLLLLLFGEAMGYRSSLPFQVLRGFGFAIMCLVCLALFRKLSRSVRSVPLLLSLLVLALWMGCGGVVLGMRLVGAIPLFDIPTPAYLLLSLCTSWLVFQEGYPERSGWNGALRSISSTEEQLPLLRARLMVLENAAARQDRLVAAGMVAAGAAHEFKNVLSVIRASAEYGLGQATSPAKDRALSLVVENTRSARDSAVDALEKLAAEGRESTRLLDVARALEPFLRRERAALRGSGIIVETSIARDTVLQARPGDVEQVLHNLIQNAAQAYVRQGDETGQGMVIRVCARRVGDYVAVEVCDTAGGVVPDKRRELFAPGASGWGSTGLGLYLSRNLAQASGGTVEYEPTDKGSIFRLVLPAEEGEEEG